MNEPSKEVQRYADVAMYNAEPLDKDVSGAVTPTVYLLRATADPLGSNAAGAMMYEGRVVRNITRDVTDDDRRHYLAQIMKTHLKAPFELIDFHFMLEGVTRSFTHQMVRQRTAVFMQESLRFAVKQGVADEVALPPSLANTTAEWRGMVDQDMLSQEEKMRRGWDQTLDIIERNYEQLIGMGMPAEDARGLLPHNVGTRLNYKTDLRNLVGHAGNRLCTQAQFEWRLVWLQIVQAISRYCSCQREIDLIVGQVEGEDYHLDSCDNWQFQELAGIFKPICYLTGKCEFKATFDRSCSIRNRVDANHDAGRPSNEWAEEYDHVEGNPIVVGVGPNSVARNDAGHPVFIGAIRTEEWLLDPAAARQSM